MEKEIKEILETQERRLRRRIEDLELRNGKSIEEGVRETNQKISKEV
ncbi:hypothetical protein ES703_81057 [subsurface metagenome]